MFSASLRRAAAQAGSAAGKSPEGKSALSKGAKRDPELYVSSIADNH